MLLAELIDGLGLEQVPGSVAADSVEVRAVTDDSRQVTVGAVFIARSGTKTHGQAFINDAITRGACAIIADQPPAPDSAPSVPLAWLVCPRVDNALVGTLAERFHDHPARKLTLIGVTGTKGKTTTAYLIQHLLQRAGVPCGLIGTVCIDDGRRRRGADLTTPGAADFSAHLAAMVAHGCRAAVAEVSSQALHQGRVGALRFDVGVFTNLTGDHLDYHGTMDEYADAKAILFENLQPKALAIINEDDDYAERMVRGCKARVLRCCLDGPMADETHCTATVLDLQADKTRARFDGAWGSVEAGYPLVGRHNAINALQAIATAYAVIGTPQDYAAMLQDFPGVPGRLERVVIPSGNTESASGAGGTSKGMSKGGPAVLVDYAHTHDSLEKVLEALRPLVRKPGKLVVMFGCGGDRDRTKRPRMAAVACRLADRVFITSDNPRTEDPQAIIAEILAGIPSGANVVHEAKANAQAPVAPAPPVGARGRKARAGVALPPAEVRVIVQPDRAAAIMQAVTTAAEQDVVLLAGKGHEDYQIIGAIKRHFDDREHAAAALRLRPGAGARSSPAT